MARKRPPVTTASLVGLVAGLSGCEQDPCDGLRTFDPPPEPEPSPSAPPVVLEGEWIGAGVLELSFSKPLQEGNTPDPARFAVLGWAAQVQPYDSYAGSDICYVRTRYSVMGVGYYGSASVVDVWIAPEDPSVMRLRVSNSGASCRTVPDTLGDGVMLVYTNGEGEALGNLLLDADGEPVPDLGPAWAIQALEGCSGPYYYCSLGQTYTGHLPSVTSLADIPCP